MALLSDINDITGEGSACSLLQVPLAAIRSAANSLDDMKNNPPAGIQQLAQQMRNIEPPTIPGVDTLADGIRSLRSQLPDASELTQPLADAMGEFFGAINDNVSGQLDGMLGSFSGLSQLTEIGSSNPVDGTLTDKLQEMQLVLDVIPNPLTVPSLLEFIKDGLARFPRGIYPYRYLPLLDELRDKLETTLKWNELDGNGIAADLENTLELLEAAIRRIFVEEGVGSVTRPIDAFAASVDENLLTTALDGIQTNLGLVKTAVQNGDLTGTEPAIAALAQYQGDVEAVLAGIASQNPVTAAAKLALEGLPTEMEDRAIHFLSIIQPPHDLEALGHAFQPLNSLLESSGLSVFIDKISDFVGSIRGVLDSLNISSFKDGFVQALQAAESAVNGLREVLMRVTIEFSALMDRVRQAIQSLGISSAVDAMENALRSFIQLVQQTADTIFAPVRNFLLGIFNAINGFLAQLDPSVVVATLKNILSKFTDLLSNPQLLDAIDSVKGALDTVNGELGTFTFKPGTDVVVDGIGVVEEALKIASSLPLPDSLKKELRDALNKLPRSIDPAVEVITDGLDEIVDEGPRPVLIKIKEGPAKLVEIISAYSPEKLVTECLGTTYQDFLTEMERFKPTSLLVPIQEALEVVKTEIRRIADPTAILSPLQVPFDELLGLLDAFDPEEIIAPLNDQLQDGIQAIIYSLPIGTANEIFDQVANVADKIQSVANALTSVHDFLDGFRLRFAGLADARTQANTLGSEIADRIDQVADISSIMVAMGGVSNALDEIQSAALTTKINDSLGALEAKFNGLDAKNKLAAIAAALQVFPRQDLENLAPSPNQTNLIAFLDAFQPLDAAFTAPVDLLDAYPAQLSAAKAGFVSLMQEWDARFLEPTGPIMQLHQPALSVTDLKNLLKQTIQDQLTDTLEPVMQIIEYFQAGFDGIMVQLAGLIQDINDVLADILAITDALEELRDAVNQLIQTLLTFDLGFIADGFRTVFDTIRTEIQAFSPTHIGEILGRAFDEILELLDINVLLGAAALDGEYAEIIVNLRKLDPGKIIIEVLQPEFEKVLAFLMRFDLTVQIDAFLANIDRLKAELRVELGRVADSYEEMWQAIPSGIGSVTGTATVSVTVTT